MFRKVTRALAGVALVLTIVGSRIWGSAAPLPVAGASTTPLDPRPSRALALEHPAIGEIPTVLEARRMITPQLSLQSQDA